MLEELTGFFARHPKFSGPRNVLSWVQLSSGLLVKHRDAIADEKGGEIFSKLPRTKIYNGGWGGRVYHEVGQDQLMMIARVARLNSTERKKVISDLNGVKRRLKARGISMFFIPHSIPPEEYTLHIPPHGVSTSAVLEKRVNEKKQGIPDTFVLTLAFHIPEKARAGVRVPSLKELRQAVKQRATGIPPRRIIVH